MRKATGRPDTAAAEWFAMVAITSYPRAPIDAAGCTAVATTAALGSSLPCAASTSTTLGRTGWVPGGEPGGGGTRGGGASSRSEWAARSVKATMRFPATGLSPSARAAAAMQPVRSEPRWVGLASSRRRRTATRSKLGAASGAGLPAQSPTVAGSSGPSRSSAASASLRARAKSVCEPRR